jgi:hypothetical protein
MLLSAKTEECRPSRNMQFFLEQFKKVNIFRNPRNNVIGVVHDIAANWRKFRSERFGF